ncbi:MAG: twin-arginine translocation signal domain-containing protein [Tannerella sp.]|jgi:hypothetical protein|nr:twin-arginine translocation signal domain-containing protein [Tannerella sp.]
MTTRRKFIKQTTIGVAAISWGNIIPEMSAKSCTNIIGAPMTRNNVRMKRTCKTACAKEL